MTVDNRCSHCLATHLPASAEACSVDLVALRQELEAFIEQTTPVLPASEEERDTQPTLSFQRCSAVFHVQLPDVAKTGANVFVAIFSEQESRRPYCCVNTKSAGSTWSTLSSRNAKRRA
ncbi:MAG: hypothetical protein ACLTXH_03565 [Enterobacter hormaechei]